MIHPANRASCSAHLLAILVFWLAAAAAAAEPPAAGCTICTATDAHGAMYIPVRVDDRINARFFFDTGSVTFLSDTFVRSHGMPTHPLLDSTGAAITFSNGAPVNAARTSIALLGTPLVIKADVPVLRSDIIRSMGVSCDGIIGIDALGSMAILVNMADRRITFWQNGRLLPVTLRELGMTPSAAVPLIPAIGSGCQVSVTWGDSVKSLMMVDTGSEFTRVWEELAHKISSGWKAGGRIDIATGSVKVYTARVGRLALGGVEAAEIRVVYSDRSTGPVPNPLGRDFLSRSEFLLDFPAGKIYLRRLDFGPGPTPFARRMRGDDPLLAHYPIHFPYGGHLTGASGRKSVPAGSDALVPLDGSDDALQVLRNPPPENASAQPVEIAAELLDGALVVPVKAGAAILRLALDTGAVCSWISPAGLNRLGIKPQVIEQGDVRQSFCLLPTLSLGGSAPEFSAGVAECFFGDRTGLFCLSPRDLKAIDGVLGLDWLAGQTIGIDLNARRITLWPMASTEAERQTWVLNGGPRSGAATVALEHEAGDWFTAAADAGGVPVKLALATGYTGSVRLPDYPDYRGAFAAPPARVAGAGPARVVETLALGSLKLPQVALDVVPAKGADSVPVLGLQAFHGRRILLNLAANRLTIGPLPAQAGKPAR